MPYPTAFTVVPPGSPGTAMRSGQHLMAHANLAVGIPAIERAMGLGPPLTLAQVGQFWVRLNSLGEAVTYQTATWAGLAVQLMALTRRLASLDQEVYERWSARFGRRYDLVFPRQYPPIPGGAP